METIKQLSPKPGIELLAVKVPEGYTNAYIQPLSEKQPNRLFLEVFNDNGDFLEDLELPFPCKLLGVPSEIEEEVWQTLMPLEDGAYYLDYVLFRGHLQNYFDTAKESGLSLLEANEVYAVNPYGEEPAQFKHTTDRPSLDFDIGKWLKAEANVGNWIILLKL